MRTWKTTLVSVLIGLVATPTFAIDGYRILQRTSDVLVLEGREQFSTNIGIVLSDSGVALIDPMPELHRLESLQQKIDSLTTSSARYVANTHAHEDHSGGNQFFLSAGAEMSDTAQLQRLGIVTYSVTSHTGQDRLYYHEQSNTLFTGDVFDNSWHPTFYAGGIEGFANAMQTILSICDEQTLIVPGHGATTTCHTVERFYQNTLHWVSLIEALHERQMSVQDMLKQPEVIVALANFNPSKQDDWFPQRAIHRFVERTLVQISRQPD